MSFSVLLAMDSGYSGTPLAKKLGFEEGLIVRLMNEPLAIKEHLEQTSPGHSWWLEGQVPDVTVLFADSMLDCEASLVDAIPRLRENSSLWVAWPKKSSKVPTDINEKLLRDRLLPIGLVDNKICAIDETWSALRFVWRLKQRSNLSLGS